MSTSIDRLPVAAVRVEVTDETLAVDLSDGRTISVPISWYPRLTRATVQERQAWKLIGAGAGIHWESIDEDISVEALIAGRPSSESQASIDRWVRGRTR
jgi:hypothetical protein